MILAPMKTEISKHMKVIVVCLVVMLAIVIAPLLSGYFGTLLTVKVRFIDIQGIVSDRKINAVNRQLANLNLEALTIEEIKVGLEELSWIRLASIRKIWPDRMNIHLEEQVPLAHWNENEYLNSDGNVFSSEFLGDHDLPFLQGPKGAERLVMWQFQKLNSVVGVTGRTISSLGLNDRGGWSFVLGDISIRLGKEDIMERMRRFLRVYRELESADRFMDIAGIDTRYPNGVAVNWKQKKCSGECYAEITSLKRDIAL
ncbi:MAG: cell division protein FtsQ/DivIB [Gammaproteobacteria bacterium]|nr:cell division protein FtsQ/DivIB [Gammaproteobacteria bacterium]